MVLKKTIILSSGGTGGHVFPAQSLAHELSRRGYRVVMVTDERGTLFRSFDYISKVYSLAIKQAKGRLGVLKLLGSVVLSLLQGLFIFFREKPVAVVGFGGYPSIPPMIIGWILRKKTIIHEQNAVLGRANRLAAFFAHKIATSFPKTLKLPADAVVTVTGNPVRLQILSLQETSYPSLGSVINLLVIGGSQGAKIFSEVLPKALGRLPEDLRKRIHLTQQCRKEYLNQTISDLKAIGMSYEVKPFFEDMDQQLQKAHLVISRSGASSSAELAIAGKPVIFVPFAAAMDAHQQRNAEYFVKEQAAWMILEKEFTPESLSSLLKEILLSTTLLSEKAEKIRKYSYPDAVVDLANLVEDLLPQDKR
jgi:UDP-N-acetylglucosamine--N-acetylmuramyl-(pentapeptide) pyrophosphoryl-undecaprenol N-acetylglucosamine transferase